MSTIFNSEHGDWQMNAAVGMQRYFSNKWNGPALGFQLAAESLYRELKANRRGTDLLVYPIIYNYRHSIELRLKEIIERGSKLMDKEQGVPTHHNLYELWKTAKPILLKIYPEMDNDSEVSDMETVFQEFSQYDASSTAFRYPVDKKGNPSLQFSMINLDNFVEKVTPTVTLLDGATAGIAAFEDYKND